MKTKTFTPCERTDITLSRLSIALFTFSLILYLSVRSVSADEALGRVVELDIPQGTSLESALLSWGAKARVTVMINTETVDGLRTAESVRGLLSAAKALELILRGSGLHYSQEGDRVQIVPTKGLERLSFNDDGQPTPASQVLAYSSNSDKTSESEDGNRDHVTERGIEQVIVTAQKREERLQDVPIPVSVINTKLLSDTNQLKIIDYYSQVPGLSAAPGLAGSLNLSIRGISTNDTTGGGSPTVGVVIDDVPFSTGLVVPDFDPGDLARIEVLRGPQGTLYGASSMGGLIKFDTLAPSPQGASGRLEAGIVNTDNSSDVGYSVRGSANAPLTDDLAFRISGFMREDPGYLTNPVLGIKDINTNHVEGGHFALLWRPSQNWSLRLSALYQFTSESHTSDITDQETITGHYGSLSGLQQGYIAGCCSESLSLQAYSAVLKGSFGGFDLTSITALNRSSQHVDSDLSHELGGISQAVYGVNGWLFAARTPIEQFTQELRLSAPLGARFDDVLGLFYQRTNTPPAVGEAYSTNSYTGERVAHWATFGDIGSTNVKADESAVFVNLTYHVTSQFDVQIGGRENRDRVFESTTVLTGPLFGGQPLVIHNPAGTTNSFTYLFSPQYKFSPELMAYIRLSSGFRPGGPNGAVAVAEGAPSVFDPDKTKNYEVGTKGEFLNHKLSLDASVYYIDWKDIQLTLAGTGADNTPFVYAGNGGGAKSEGAEISVQVAPVSGLDITGWFAYDNAKITSYPANAVVGFYAAPGNRLPYAPQFSGNLSITEQFPLGPASEGFVGGAVSYVGGRESIFTSTAQRQYLPAYSKIDLRAGVNHRLWTVSLYANNVTNKLGYLSGGLGNVNPFAFSIIQPRTVGLSVTREFH